MRRFSNNPFYRPNPSNEEFLRKPNSDPLCLSNPSKSTENNSPCIPYPNKPLGPQNIGETFNNYNPKPHVTSSTHNIIKHLETPIKTSATVIKINKQETCGNSKEINRTIATTLPEYKLSAETRVHNLKAQLDQLTSVESRVHSLIAQLDLLANL